MIAPQAEYIFIKLISSMDFGGGGEADSFETSFQ